MKLSTNTTGTGPRHVGFVHGLGANGETWHPLLERMLATDRYTVTVIDLRGHGRSARASSYGLDELADDVVESLPHGLDSVVGHSLGGSVLVRAVDRLSPRRAIYLDPGFHLALPTSGVKGRLFWLAPALTLGVAQLLQQRKSKTVFDPATKATIDEARKQFDMGMAIDVFRDVAFHPVPIAPPAVPSTIVLSDDAPSVLPDSVAAALGEQGWEVRRLPGVRHDMHLEDPARVFELIADEI